jgi:hypothetical protein
MPRRGAHRVSFASAAATVAERIIKLAAPRRTTSR